MDMNERILWTIVDRRKVFDTGTIDRMAEGDCLDSLWEPVLRKRVGIEISRSIRTLESDACDGKADGDRVEKY